MCGNIAKLGNDYTVDEVCVGTVYFFPPKFSRHASILRPAQPAAVQAKAC